MFTALIVLGSQKEWLAEIGVSMNYCVGVSCEIMNWSQSNNTGSSSHITSFYRCPGIKGMHGCMWDADYLKKGCLCLDLPCITHKKDIFQHTQLIKISHK